MTRLSTLCLSLCLTACAAPAGRAVLDSSAPPVELRSDVELRSAAPAPVQQPVPGVPRRPAMEWRPGQPLMHGFFGASMFDKVEADASGGAIVDGDRGDVDEYPVIGGGAQWKYGGGERIDWGLEGLMSFGWRGDAEAFVIGGGGATVAIEVDLLIFELFGGPFASVFLGDKLRVYGAVGPIMQFADYSQSGNLDDDGSGFGYGWYARTGAEFVLPSRTLLGFGVRWSDTEVDLGGSLGDLEMEGVQAVLTVSRGI